MRNTAKTLFVVSLVTAVQAWWPFGSAAATDPDPEPTAFEENEYDATDVIEVEPVLEPVLEMTRETVQGMSKDIRKRKDSKGVCMLENKFSTLNHHSEVFSGVNTCEFKKSIARDSVTALENQILGAGGQLNKISVKEVGPGSNGVFTTEDIKEGETVMFIPREMMLTLEEAENSSIF